MTSTPPESPDDRFRLPPLEGVYEGNADPVDEREPDEVDEPDEAEEAPAVSLDEPLELAEPADELAAERIDLAAAADAIESLRPPREFGEFEDADEDVQDESVIATAAAVIHAAEDDLDEPAAPPFASAAVTQAPDDDDWLPDFLSRRRAAGDGRRDTRARNARQNRSKPRGWPWRARRADRGSRARSPRSRCC